jgi:putative transposase
VFLEHDTRRRLHIAGVTQHPTQDWTTQQARNPAITDAPQDKLRFLLRDRDTKYSGSFDAVFQAKDINILTSAPPAPKMHAHCERVIRTLRSEVCDHVLILNEAHAREVLTAYQQHYNQHRPHQARQQRPPERHHQTDRADENNVRTLLRTPVLNRLINEYSASAWSLTACRSAPRLSIAAHRGAARRTTLLTAAQPWCPACAWTTEKTDQVG